MIKHAHFVFLTLLIGSVTAMIPKQDIKIGELYGKPVYLYCHSDVLPMSDGHESERFLKNCEFFGRESDFRDAAEKISQNPVGNVALRLYSLALSRRGEKVTFCNVEDNEVYKRSMRIVLEPANQLAHQHLAKLGIPANTVFLQLFHPESERQSMLHSYGSIHHMHINFSRESFNFFINKDMNCIPQKMSKYNNVFHELKHFDQFDQDGKSEKLGLMNGEAIYYEIVKICNKPMYFPSIVGTIFPKKWLEIYHDGYMGVIPKILGLFTNDTEFNAMTGLSVHEGKIYFDPLCEWGFQLMEPEKTIRGMHICVPNMSGVMPVVPVDEQFFPKELYRLFFMQIAPKLQDLLNTAYESKNPFIPSGTMYYGLFSPSYIEAAPQVRAVAATKKAEEEKK